MSLQLNWPELRTNQTVDLIFPWWRTSTWKSKQPRDTQWNHSVTKWLLFLSPQASQSSPNHSTPPIIQTVDIWRQRRTSPPFGQQDTSPNFNYFAASLPQTPTSIKTGLTLDPYFSHEGIKKLDIKPYTIWITDVTTWQEQGSSTIPYHSDYQQQFISHCQQIWDGWGVDTRVVIPDVAYLSNNHTRFILVINQLDAQNFVLQ